jgi:hypothetical protein
VLVSVLEVQERCSAVCRLYLPKKNKLALSNLLDRLYFPKKNRRGVWVLEDCTARYRLVASMMEDND